MNKYRGFIKTLWIELASVVISFLTSGGRKSYAGEKAEIKILGKLEDVPNGLNEIFDKVYVVSYEGSDRIKSISDRLKNLDFEVFYGCNSNDLSTEELFKNGYKRAEKGAPGYMTEGVFACAFSHLYLYRKLKKEKNINNILILEDDSSLVEQNIVDTVECYNMLPEDWDVLFLGYGGKSVPKNYNKKLYKGEGYRMGDNRLRILEGTFGYAINNNFLDIILEKQENPETFGGAEFWDLFYKLKYFACLRKCIVHDYSCGSLIGKRKIK